MTHTVHFADKTLFFGTEPPAGATWHLCRPLADEDLHRAKIVKILETNKRVALLCDDPDAAFSRFAEGFAVVTAGGGVAVDAGGRRLMIFRNGRWDLPKGHLEQGESLEACAEREIAEETGIATRAVAPLCSTWHAYWFEPTRRWELKRTCWFLLEATGGVPTPQREEGVDRVEWCTPEEARAHAAESFPTIRRVMEALDGIGSGDPAAARP